MIAHRWHNVWSQQIETNGSKQLTHDFIILQLYIRNEMEKHQKS